jgi:hypothetical protein
MSNFVLRANRHGEVRGRDGVLTTPHWKNHQSDLMDRCVD